LQVLCRLRFVMEVCAVPSDKTVDIIFRFPIIEGSDSGGFNNLPTR